MYTVKPSKRVSVEKHTRTTDYLEESNTNSKSLLGDSIKIKSSSRLRDTWDKREQRETKGHADYKYTREQVKTGRAGRQSDSWETHKEKRQVT